jgi:hypothetical protein
LSDKQVMRIIIFLFTFLFLFSNTKVLAQDAIVDDLIEDIFPKMQLSNNQMKVLQEELRIQKMLIEGVQEINIVNGGYSNLGKATDTVHDLLISSVGAKSSSVPKEIQGKLLDAVRKGTDKETIKKMLVELKDFTAKNIDPSVLIHTTATTTTTTASKVTGAVNKFAKGKYVWGASLARRFGIQVGIFYALAAQVDYTMPIILTAMGHPEIGLPLLATPFSSTSTATFILGKKALKFRHLVKTLGGKDVVMDHFKVFRKVKNFFGQTFFAKNELIDITVAGKKYILTVEQENLFTKFKQKMGWNKKLNYDNMIKFLREESFMPELVRRIENSDRPKHTKWLRLLIKIEKNGSKDLVNKMRSRFGKFINEIEYLPKLTEQRTWVLRAASSTSFKELYAHMSRIPDNIPPRTLDKIWRNYILKNATKNIGDYSSRSAYKAFRNLFEDYDKDIRNSLFNSSDYSMTSDMRTNFKRYMRKALTPISACEMNFVKLQQYAPTY